MSVLGQNIVFNPVRRSFAGTPSHLTAIAHRAVPVDPLDEPLSTPAVAGVTPYGRHMSILPPGGVVVINYWPPCTFSSEAAMQLRRPFKLG